MHTHSTFAAAWAQAGQDIPCYGTTHADYFYGAVPCARSLTAEEVEADYEGNTGRVIAETFRSRGLDPAAVPGVLCRSHGPFTWGKDPAQAVYHAAVLEEIAKMALLTRQLDPGAAPAPQYVQDKHYLRKHGPTPTMARAADKPHHSIEGGKPMDKTELKKIDAYWRAANYLAAGQLYLLDNPLLRRPLTRADVKKKIVGHWGTVPGQNFVYVHLNRIIKKYDQDMILISGPGHGGNFFVANAYLDGTYSEVYPNISRDEEGMRRLFKQFSFPGGISSHVAPETPGSINEGGELGYSIATPSARCLITPT